VPALSGWCLCVDVWLSPQHRVCACLLPPYPPQAVRLSDFGTPGADLSGVHYLRSVADADALLQGVTAAKAAGGKVGRGCCAVLRPLPLAATAAWLPMPAAAAAVFDDCCQCSGTGCTRLIHLALPDAMVSSRNRHAQGVWSTPVPCTAHSTQAHSTQHTAHSTQHTAHSTAHPMTVHVCVAVTL
jgi:hypothetical protein